VTALLRCFGATLRQIAREREAFMVLVGATVIYGLVYPTPYLRQLLRKVPVMVVDRDQTRLSRQIARWLDASEGVTVTGRTNDLDAAQDAVRAGTAGGVVLIPKDFQRQVLRGEPAYVGAYADASYLLVYRTVTGAVNGVVGTLSAGVSVRRLQSGGASYAEAVARRQPVAVAGWPLFNPSAGYATFIVPAVFILILQQTMLIGIGTLRVAERHTRAGAAEPIWAVLGGNLAVLTLIYLLHAAFLFVVVFRVYGLPMRATPGAVAAFLVPFIAATTLLALIIAEVFERPETSTIALVATSIPALFLSGASFPIDAQATWVRALSVALPSTFAIRGFLQLGVMGAQLGEAWRSWGALWLQVAAYGAAAWLVIRRRRSTAIGS
jgi:ABC-2 type transport system permease protein